MFTDPEIQSSESDENDFTSKGDNAAMINLEEKMHALKSYKTKVKKRQVAHFDKKSDHDDIIKSVTQPI